MPFLLIVLPLAACAGESKYFQPNEKIPLADVKGRIDHLAVDLTNKRLFVAALGNNTLEVIDLKIGKRIYTIKGLEEPQGVLFISDANKIVVSNGGNGKVDFYDAHSLKLTNTIDFESDADNLRYDAAAKRLYVGYGEGAIGVIDARKAQKITDIKLAGHPESFQMEKSGNRIFVNIPSARQITVIDKQKSAIVTTWPLKDFNDNFPMALDEKNHRLFVGCRKPARLVVIDSDTGKIVANLECSGDADDIFYDASKRRIYITGGEGFVSIVEQMNSDNYKAVTKVATAQGARTSLFVPELDRLYVAVGHRGEQKAQILAYDVK